MKRLLITVVFACILLLTFPASAGPAATFVVSDVALENCDGPLIEGVLRLSAYDSDGLLVNGSSPASTTVYATHSNGPAGAVGWDFLSGEEYQFAYSVGSADAVNVSIVIELNSDPSVVSPTVTIGCDGSVSFGGGSGGADSRLNLNHCDLTSAVYWTGLGFEVWDIQPDSTGEFMGAYSPNDLAEFADAPPAENTFIGAIGMTTLEVLTTGELQIKIAPDAEGKACTMIVDGIPPTFVYFLD